MDAEVLHSDLTELCRALGLPAGPVSASPHEVFQECLREVRRRIPAHPFSAFVEDALKAKPDWTVQSFEFYAAHYLVGGGLTQGDLDGHVRSLAGEMKQQYDIGVEHSRRAPDEFVAA